MLTSHAQCLYFADVVQYLTTAVPTMCLTFPTPSLDDPDPWQEKPFFQLTLPSAPSATVAPDRSEAVSPAPESRSKWVRRMLFKRQTESAQEMYTVSYFGEPLHAPAIIPPSGSTRDRVTQRLLRTTRRGLPPEEAAYVELMAHGLYVYVCNHKRTFVTAWQVEKAMLSHSISIKWFLHTLQDRLGECGFKSDPSKTDSQWHPLGRFAGIESLSSRVFDSRKTRPSRNQLERTISAISEYRRSFQMVRPHTDFVRSTQIRPQAASRPMSWGPTTAPLPGMI